MFSIYLSIFLLASYYYLKRRIADYFSFDARIKAFQTEQFQDTPETLDPVWRPVKGTLPPYLNGILYRIGPGKYNLGKLVINHAFDGMPYIHRLQVSSERQAVLYNSRNTATEAGHILVHDPAKAPGVFGHIQELSAWERVMAIWNRLTNPIVPKRGDPSSLMIGVTVSPNYPVPASWNENEQQQQQQQQQQQLGENTKKVLVAKTDVNALQLVHSDRLSPEKLFSYEDYGARLNGELSAAHHQYDPVTGEIFNFTVSMFPIPKLVVFSISRSGRTTVLAEITHRKLKDGRRTRISVPYIHSFWVTRRFIVIPESPLHYQPLDFLLRGVALGGMTWDHSAPAYLHVISRIPDIGHVTTIPTDPFCTFHVGNAWDFADENGKSVVVMDCCAFSDGDILYQLHSFGNPRRKAQVHKDIHPPPEATTKPRGISMPPIRQPSFGDLRRYRLTLSTEQTCSYDTIATNIEFLRFSQKVSQLPYKYAWGCQLRSATREGTERYSLVKIDLDTGETLKFDRSNFTCSEPIFVPSSVTSREDEGCLLSFVNVVDDVDPRKDRCALLVLDAHTMEQVAFCDIGPFKATTFHGSFVDNRYEDVSIN